MNQLNVKLLFHSPKELVLNAIRTCWKSYSSSDNFGDNDKNLIRNIIKKGHTSTLEHSIYTFYVENISRAILQEVARHRIGIGISVESTRYTFKKIINSVKQPQDLLISTGNDTVDQLTIDHINNLRKLVKDNKDLTNDIVKYGITENYPVTFQMSFNIRSLRHFISLRQSKKAHFEIRKLASAFKELIPEDHLIFFEDI